MSKDHIATYLNDHLAGAAVALELLDGLEGSHRGTPLEPFLTGLRADVNADREELAALMRRLKIPESRVRQASAWLAEKLTGLKLLADDPSGGELRLFESLEALSLGIEGKRSLWLALEAVAGDESVLRGVDYGRLAGRAEEQRARVEAQRVAAAKRALAVGG